MNQDNLKPASTIPPEAIYKELKSIQPTLVDLERCIQQYPDLAKYYNIGKLKSSHKDNTVSEAIDVVGLIFEIYKNQTVEAATSNTPNNLTVLTCLKDSSESQLKTIKTLDINISNDYICIALLGYLIKQLGNKYD